MTTTEVRPGSAPQAASRTDEDGFVAARRAMIDSQLRTSGVNDLWLLERFAAVPREQFVPDNARAAAYADRAVPLGNGRWLGSPEFHGKMLGEARPTRDDKVLLMSGGSRYLAALVEPLVGSLSVIEIDQAFSTHQGEGEHTLLLIDGAIEVVPDTLAGRLAEGARVVTGLVERGVTRLATGRNTAGIIALFPLAELGIPLLPEFAAPKRWSF